MQLRLCTAALKQDPGFEAALELRACLLADKGNGDLAKKVGGSVHAKCAPPLKAVFFQQSPTCMLVQHTAGC